MLHPSVHPAGSRHEVAGYGAIRPPLPTAGYKVPRGTHQRPPLHTHLPPAPETIQFLVIIIFNLFADGSQQTVTLTSLMLAAAFFGISRASGISLISPTFQHLL